MHPNPLTRRVLRTRLERRHPDRFRPLGPLDHAPLRQPLEGDPPRVPAAPPRVGRWPAVRLHRAAAAVPAVPAVTGCRGVLPGVPSVDAPAAVERVLRIARLTACRSDEKQPEENRASHSRKPFGPAHGVPPSHADGFDRGLMSFDS